MLKYCRVTAFTINTIKTYLFNVKPSTFIESSRAINYQGPKFKAVDIFRILKYKNTFPRDYVPNWSEEVFPIKKCKNTVLWRYAISELKGKEVVRIAKTNQKEFRVEKLIKGKGNKLYVKWKGYNSSFKRPHKD